MISHLQAYYRKLGSFARFVIAASLLSSLGVYGAPPEPESNMPDSGSHPGAVVVCTSEYYYPGAEYPVEAHYGITLFDKSVAGTETLSDTDSLKEKAARDEMIMDILGQEGVSEENGDHNIRCQPPVFRAVNTGDMQGADVRMEASQHRNSSIYYTVTAKRGNSDLHYLTQNKRGLNVDEFAHSGAMSTALTWSRNAKMVFVSVTAATIVILVGPYALVMVPGGSISVATLTAFVSFLTYRSNPLRERVAKMMVATPAAMVTVFDAIAKTLGGMEQSTK